MNDALKKVVTTSHTSQTVQHLRVLGSVVGHWDYSSRFCPGKVYNRLGKTINIPVTTIRLNHINLPICSTVLFLQNGDLV